MSACRDSACALHVDTSLWPTVRALVARAATRRRVPPQDHDDIASGVWMRLTQDNARAFRQFRGDGPVRAYLAVIVEREILDWQSANWGRWRPTREAKRLGPAAVSFERLVHRDRLSASDARATLAAQNLCPPALTCDRLSSRRPQALRRRVPLTDVEPRSANDPWTSFREASRRGAGRRLGRQLLQVLRSLPAADQVALRLRYEQGLKVNQIAGVLAVDVKKMYRRLAAIHADLKRGLMDLGVSPDEAADLVGGATACVPRILRSSSRETA